ncbi:TetR/AcrR family transcriptional regulator [Nitratireductor pacificus]|uniref:TetR family transcriptional regulator n=1 Tax=Nitratireductor pacificus pht-3B TaxID=391937 RepID=K2N539_9HYPH|nr:TetR/AcrR family transcriptional regulator [Nitratireductor pacificus]EKF19323.1 TetR family transcriptional regulator [Nitratireductor pacificus pht-3B]
MTKSRSGARDKILEAAGEIVRETGAGSMSLDAVAARAGVSKGGLLYHFSSKSKLFEALVEKFMHEEDAQLREREAARAGVANAPVQAYIDHFVGERARRQPPPSGLLAALAEDPEFLKPVQRFERDVLDRMKAGADDPALAVIALLVVHGIRAMELLSINVVDEAETDQVVDALRRLLEPA